MRDLSSGALALLSVTCVVSLLGLFVAPQLIRHALFRPYWLLRRAEYSRLVTSGFVHADIGHLLFNAITFYSFAFPLEHEVGTIKFVALYFTGLLFGNLGTFLNHRTDPNYCSLGASGAILAVMFTSILYFPGQHLIILPLPLPIPAPLFALGYLAYSYYSARRGQGQINHDAHIGGALSGLAFVAVTDPSAYRNLLTAMLG